jgi:polyisoprenyl-phosphate glycosyltransferase
MEAVKYSVVIPLYNEEESLPALISGLREVMGELDGPTEVLMVDDGSRDSTYQLMTEANREDSRFKIIQLSRNFGHQLAITAGMDAAAGDAVIVMDADLQDPPHVIIEMAAKWQEGYEVVNAVREARQGERLFKTATATVFYNLLHRFADVEHTVDVGDFRLVDRKALDAFLQMRETNRYVRGMFSWIGFRQVSVPYTRASRHAGTTKYTLRKMVRFASDAVIGFSTAPLRLALGIGLFLAFAAVCYGLVAIGLKLAGLSLVPGYASLLVTVTFLSGVQLIVTGMVGQYVARIYDEARARPLYLVREVRGFGDENGRIMWPAIGERNGHPTPRIRP